MNKIHIPVLLREMLSLLSPKNGGIYVDATFGSGGYSKAILDSADCKIYAIDRDETVIEFYNKLSTEYQGKVELFIDKFSNMKNYLDIKDVDGIVFDLGVSSMQIDQGERGFSFMYNGPLDMRMDKFSHINASTFVNQLYEKEIANIIYDYSGERHSRRIARAIVSARQKKHINTTFELAEIIRSVVFRGKSKIDPATRTFQAIRIWVNDELGELEKGIKAAFELLNKGGRLIIISFHSLEDRIVKRFFQDSESIFPKKFSLLSKKVIKVSEQEVNENPRSRSAKLRAIERVL
ncbi:16S rRNA (cytosine(1402)-N(4))-methyltransferase [Wolbachia pipientis]|uniref:Ribosomal RNA small subunit methyltransferase H n=1 Tax=Wolbachia pipientis TaxID=955 RepID=A0A1E7QLN6_WOLPI|nr:16S rRNA (cytosine(1402)-N(4))-methyltransferase RsmH [Wolbachia pipientis]OEY87129.1 16S rRNA (cytosine(1402)-N(4))-methyltransferase [Wolbachia pipientis]